MTGLSVAEVLNRAADLLTPEGAWTQGAGARDRDGRALVAPHPNAVCWCAFGAIAQVGGDNPDCTSVVYRASRLLDHDQKLDIIEWQDKHGRTQAEVVAALRSAATLASNEK